ncbi:ABC transporter ATP-binding protein [Sutcliffiella sp. NPDC057660]|uniref:ABC transporter ATP-binding protein n=1 Tax=Sutcliffiella sp. NPDC057660 TaxID=3346199 RepID=UPI0036A06E8B
MIHLNHISKTFNVGNEIIHALHNLTLTVEKGEWLSILGPSGSGKSTLLNCMGGLDIPESGEVMIDQVSTSTMTTSQLQSLRRNKIGFIFQDFKLLPQYNVLDNVCLPRLPYESKKRVKTRALNLIEEVGLSHRLSHLPSELSGGEKQRVAIARALINNPDIIICDEPTGNLDIQNRNRILELLKILHQQKYTIIIATHDTEVADKGERSIFIRDGSVEDGVLK